MAQGLTTNELNIAGYGETRLVRHRRVARTGGGGASIVGLRVIETHNESALPWRRKKPTVLVGWDWA